MCFTAWLVSTPLNSERVRVGWCVCVDTVDGTVAGSGGGVGNASSHLRGCVGGDGKDGAGDGLVGTVVVEVVVKVFFFFVVFVGGAGGYFLLCLCVVWEVAILCWLCCWVLMVVEVLCNWENSAVVPPSS